jgi:hypothetical protein
MCDERGVASGVIVGANKPFYKRGDGKLLIFLLILFFVCFAAPMNTMWICRETPMPSARHRTYQNVFSYAYNVNAAVDCVVYCMACIQRVRADGSVDS